MKVEISFVFRYSFTQTVTSGARFTNLRRYVVVVRYQLHVDLRITPTLFHITQLACDVTQTTSLLGRVAMVNCLLIYFDI